MKQFEINDTIVRLGETAKENWSLIDEADDQYIWMHLNSFPSGHIIIAVSYTHLRAHET